MDIDSFMKVKLNRGLAISFLIISTILPPYFFLFNFSRDLFNSLDHFRLILLCSSVGTPVLLIHFVIMRSISRLFFGDEDVVGTVESNFDFAARMAFLNFFTFFAPGVSSFVTKKQALSSNEAIRLAIQIELILFILLILVFSTKALIRRYQRHK